MNNRSNLTQWMLLILKKDLLLSYRRAATYLTPLIFFLIVVTLFPLALGPDKSLLSTLSPAIIWVTALLASLLAVESIFQEDYRDGTLDYFFISGEPIFILIFIKVLGHWMVTGVPLLIAALLSSLILFMSKDIIISLFISLFLGSFSLSLLGALGGALSLGRSAILSAIIVLPLSVPLLLLGSATVFSAINYSDYSVYLFYMGAILSLAIPGLSLATVEAIKLNYE